MRTFDCSMYDYLRAARAQLSERSVCWKFYGAVGTQALLDKHTRALGAYLRSIGVGKGDNVVLCLGNIPDAIVAFYAINRIGAIANLLHPLLPADRMTRIVSSMRPKAMFLFDEFYGDYRDALQAWDAPIIFCSACDYLPRLFRPFYGAYVRSRVREIPYDGARIARYRDAVRFCGKELDDVAIGGDDIAAYMHSGGTTGEPRTVAVSNAALNHVADNVLYSAIGGSATNRDCMLMVLPIFHTFGLGICMHTSICAGGYPVMVPKFRPASACATVRRNRITFISGVPNMYDRMLQVGKFRGRALRRLRACYCGGDRISSRLSERFYAQMRAAGNPLPLSGGYGLTEAGVTCINTPDIYREGSLGKPIRGSRFAIVDDAFRFLAAGERGMLLIGGEMLMSGYWGADPDEGFWTDAQGTRWLITGDIGYLDADGYFYFVDSAKRMVKISGVNVFPQEIENVVSQLPQIRACCAIRCVRESKNAIDLYIVLQDGMCYNQDIEHAIRDAIGRQLLKYSQPARILPIDDLPLTQIGKVDYRKAEQMIQGR